MKLPKNDKINIFDIVKIINEKTLNTGFNMTEILSEYNPFMINRALSLYPDTIFFANEMNKSTHASKKMQFDFYYNIVSKKKRYTKWQKKSIDDDEKIELLKEYYGVSSFKALDMLSLHNLLDKHNKNVWNRIKNSLNKGGKLK